MYEEDNHVFPHLVIRFFWGEMRIAHLHETVGHESNSIFARKESAEEYNVIILPWFILTED